MKITKRQLRRIIKEEKTKLIKEQSMASTEGSMMAELDGIASSIEEIANGIYGLQDPSEPGVQAGDELAVDLGMQVERLNSFFKQLEAYFVTVDELVGRNPGGSIG